MKIPRRWITLATAAAFGIAAALGVHSYIGRRIAALEAQHRPEATVAQVVPNEDLPRGTRLTSANVSIRQVPKEWAYAGALQPGQQDRFENAFLESAVSAGQPILWAQVSNPDSGALSARLSPGRRAITVPVDEISSLSGMLVPGDHIDLLVSIKKDNRSIVMPVLQRATVMATGMRTHARAADSAAESRGFTAITLEASPDEARRIFAAREIGQITAVLRAAGDNGDFPLNRADALTLLGLAAPPSAAAQTVSVIYADQWARNAVRSAAQRFRP